MRESRWSVLFLPFFFLPLQPEWTGPGNGALRAVTQQEHAAFYTVDDYDHTRDPAEDLKATVARAKKEGKRILLEVGGTWCGWCKLLDAYIHDHPSVSDKLEAGFLIMKVNWGRENRNEDFLGQYPKIRGYPHIFVLESDGTFLYSKNTVELEEGRTYNEDAILAFLDEWMMDGWMMGKRGRGR